VRFYFDVYENLKSDYDHLKWIFLFINYLNILMIFLPSVSTKPLSRIEFRFLFENKLKNFFGSVCTINGDLRISIDPSF
jgi:hypothetical protein